MKPEILKRLRDASRVVIFTGAGMSAESGIPTFRDRGTGLWENVDPLEVATPQAFQANPQRVWDWHVQLANSVRQAVPNAGHLVIAELQERKDRVTVITQNIDNLHQAAGSRHVIELHGNLMRLKSFVDEDSIFAEGRMPIICNVCNGYALSDLCNPYADPDDFRELTLRAGKVPCCPGCRALLRPDVVMFGEPLNPADLEAAWSAVDLCDAFICVGTSLEVEPAASLPRHALNRGALVIEINPVPTSLSKQADMYLAGSAARVLPTLLGQITDPRMT